MTRGATCSPVRRVSAARFRGRQQRQLWGRTARWQSLQVSQNRQLQVDSFRRRLFPRKSGPATAPLSRQPAPATPYRRDRRRLGGQPVGPDRQQLRDQLHHQRFKHDRIRCRTRPSQRSPAGPTPRPRLLSFDGMHVTLSGAPANTTASRSVRPPTSRSSARWPTRSLHCSSRPGAGGERTAANALGSALSSASQVLDHLTLKAAQIGNQLQQLNSYSSLNDDRSLQASSALLDPGSRLREGCLPDGGSSDHLIRPRCRALGRFQALPVQLSVGASFRYLRGWRAAALQWRLVRDE